MASMSDLMSDVADLLAHLARRAAGSDLELHAKAA
jgi:hypothetical protein